eukprot:scaffold2207_cov68-Isochrysis_galbana.AAC.1
MVGHEDGRMEPRMGGRIGPRTAAGSGGAQMPGRLIWTQGAKDRYSPRRAAGRIQMVGSRI